MPTQQEDSPIRFLSPLLIFLTLLGTSSLSLAADLQSMTSHACGACHQQIFTQWENSMHARSTPLKDPIFAAFYRKLVGNPLAEKQSLNGEYPQCLKCHAPAAAKARSTALNNQPAFQDGVNCISCHTISHPKVEQQLTVKHSNLGGLALGIDAYDFSNTHLQGSSGKYLSHRPQPEAGVAAATYHPFSVQPNSTVLKTKTACVGCHQMPAQQVSDVFCLVGNEQTAANMPSQCQSCHMPKVKGLADHSFLGGHSPAMLSNALLLNMQLEKQVDALRVTLNLQNLLPHNFPTGMPLRQVYVRVSAYDQAGQLVWQNYQNDPVSESPEAVLMAGLDSKNSPLNAVLESPWVWATDTRLQPLETRQLQYQVPVSKNLHVLRAEVLYELIPRAILLQLDRRLENYEHAKAKVVATAEARWSHTPPIPSLPQAVARTNAAWQTTSAKMESRHE